MAQETDEERKTRLKKMVATTQLRNESATVGNKIDPAGAI